MSSGARHGCVTVHTVNWDNEALEFEPSPEWGIEVADTNDRDKNR